MQMFVECLSKIMPTFKAIVRAHHARKDGKYPVSIRVIHNRESVCIPTGLYVTKRQVTKNYEIKDQFVLQRTNATITQYERMILDYSTEDLRIMSVKAIAERLTNVNAKADYSDYCEKLIAQDEHKWNGLKNALRIASEIGYKHLKLSDVTSSFVKRFKDEIDKREIPFSRKTGEKRTKKLSSRIKNEYLMRLHQVYKMIVLELGEDASRFTKLDPFVGVSLFKADPPKKGSIPVEDLRKFFAVKVQSRKQEIARDMVMMSFCLGGMNIGDLLLMRKENYDGERFTYNRHKTEGARVDRAKTSIKIQPEIEDLVEKYKANRGDLFFDFDGCSFERKTSRNFGMMVYKLCDMAGVPRYNFYLFRHTVASIARNKFRYSRDDVGMLLNHRGPMTVDDVYIDDDFSINDEINRKILDYVFHEG